MRGYEALMSVGAWVTNAASSSASCLTQDQVLPQKGSLTFLLTFHLTGVSGRMSGRMNVSRSLLASQVWSSTHFWANN